VSTDGATTTTDDVLAGVDLAGKRAVVTGAAAGLGRETARALAAAGASVVIAARDRGRADTAAEGIAESVPDASVEVRVLDLASLASVRAFAESYLADHDSLDLLVNNAGVMATPFGRTSDGFEMQLGTNHLGHFALTVLLADALVAAAPSRVVNLTSAGHLASDIHWDDPNYGERPYEKWEAYGQSKTANILFTVELERRLGPKGVHAYAVHPGMIITELGRHLSPEDIEDLVARADGALPTIKSIEAGAATSVWAATAAELDGQGGTYLEDCHVSDGHAPWARDPDAAARLWELSEQLTGVKLA
jgi:NAD(P)-dependent dehydrogenase (short-subunit alcohol dehydrogenase family)